VQSAHARPSDPQRSFKKPAWHVATASQHPGQFVALHVGGGGAHAPFVQASLCAEQLAHWTPPVPHEPSSVPGRQVSPLQHPLAQLVGVHFGGGPSHVPPIDLDGTHEVALAEQSTHACPPAPHAAMS